MAHAYTNRSISSGSKLLTSRTMFPRNKFSTLLRFGAPRINRDAPTVAATSTIVPAAESLTA